MYLCAAPRRCHGSLRIAALAQNLRKDFQRSLDLEDAIVGDVLDDSAVHRSAMRRTVRLFCWVNRLHHEEIGQFVRGREDCGSVPSGIPTYFPSSFVWHAICGFQATFCPLTRYEG